MFDMFGDERPPQGLTRKRTARNWGSRHSSSNAYHFHMDFEGFLEDVINEQMKN